MTILLICNSIAVLLLAILFTAQRVVQVIGKMLFFGLFFANLIAIAIQLGYIVKV